MTHHALRRLTLLVFIVSCTAESGQPVAETESSARPDAAGDPVSTSPASDSASAQGSRPDPTLITGDGWGPLRIGMSRAEVVAAAGEDAQPDAVGGPDPATCDEFRPRNAPAGVLVMVQNGVLTRISVSRTTDIATPAGFRVGSSGASVLAEYGPEAVVEPHPYWATPARYITVWREREGERRGIRYEIDADDRVVHIRAGGPSIEYAEGCV